MSTPPNDPRLQQHYEQFGREHDRLRGDLMEALTSGAVIEPTVDERSGKSFRWLRSIAHRPRLVGATVAAALVLATVIFATTGGGAASMTYANVLDRIERLRTVQYTKTMVAPADGDQRMRVLVSGRYLERQEHLGPDGAVIAITIANAETGAVVALYPQDRRFEVLSRERVILPDGSNQVRDITPKPTADVYKSIQALPPDAVPTFPERTVDGRRVVGFYHEVETPVYLWQETYWVDVETKLPIRVEKKALSRNRQWSPVEWLWSDFVFDEELDPSLFSTEPPAGYSVQEAELPGFQMPAQPEAQQEDN